MRITGNIEEYIGLLDSGERPIVDYSVLSPENVKQEAIFLGLRMTEGIDATQMLSEYGIDLRGATGELVKEGFLKWEGNMLSLTERGTSLANPVVVKILQNLKL